MISCIRTAIVDHPDRKTTHNRHLMMHRFAGRNTVGFLVFCSLVAACPVAIADETYLRYVHPPL
jgi:hypothetical protein